MLTFLTSSALTPFAIALSLVLALLVLELVAMLMGMSLLGDGGDADIDIDIDADLDADFALSTNDTMDFSTADMDAELEISAPDSSVFGWLGLGKVPFLIWAASVLTGFGLTGFIVQSVASTYLGTPLWVSLASAISLPVAVVFARHVSNIVARIMPKTETSAVAIRGLGGRVGTITQGTAKADLPAEAKIRDGYGNLHYLRVVPAKGHGPIPQGTDVLILRQKDGTFHATPLPD